MKFIPYNNSLSRFISLPHWTKPNYEFSLSYSVICPDITGSVNQAIQVSLQFPVAGIKRYVANRLPKGLYIQGSKIKGIPEESCSGTYDILATAQDDGLVRSTFGLGHYSITSQPSTTISLSGTGSLLNGTIEELPSTVQVSTFCGSYVQELGEHTGYLRLYMLNDTYCIKGDSSQHSWNLCMVVNYGAHIIASLEGSLTGDLGPVGTAWVPRNYTGSTDFSITTRFN